ncbi:SIS domain-containing protein [Virgibacillus sp. MSJ-26]|uniref:SIS domain-containing protein n=1 Tax=Virgibacillus sp. MSJ-26 TaxID=2841522 RepID=UPI001C120218|nr:SIS domain-containing protein [Virgibacillus sp. MSJ-26]MBU5465426.1 SIS domain-containing protein [Virgibacillus sp. MSJ-26]
MFNLTKQDLEQNKAMNTATEIFQQPEVWQEMIDSLLENSDSTRGFIKSIYEKHDSVRVIFTGAGTSAFAGDTLVPELRRQSQGHVQFESIATTDLVSNPTEFLYKETPTILVSFARSGNSPESVAAVNLGQDIVDDFYQINITCNKDGKLAVNSKDDENSLTILTPEKAHDQAMAMTSSFSSMIIAAYFVFTPKEFTKDTFAHVVSNANQLVENIGVTLDDIVETDFERIIYLGSGLLSQLSHEAALKMLELTSGQVVAVHESSLGFRHGPKSILNDKSAVVLFMSQDPYTRKYDMDILREVTADESNLNVIVLVDQADDEIKELANWTIEVNTEEKTFDSDFELALLYVVFAQALAMRKSIQLGITPDNPSPTGRINRVVKGVTIYER